MVEDRLHRPGLRDVGEHYAAAAAGTGEHVLTEDAHQQETVARSCATDAGQNLSGFQPALK